MNLQLALAFSALILAYPLARLARKLRQKPVNALFIFIAIVCSIAALYPVMKQSGWPHNHEYLGWRSRLVVYIYQFKEFNFIPFWSEGDAGMMGSPLPLFYHKLFYYIAAWLYFITGEIKSAVITALVLLNLWGIYGTYRACRVFQVNKAISVLVSSSLIFQYYSATDWLVRGAFAEYAAVMMAPWVIWWCVSFIKTGRYGFSIIPIMVATFLAHNIIAYFAIFLLVIANLFVYFNKPSKQLTYKLIKQNALAGLAVILILSPYLIPMAIASEYYDPGRLLLDIRPFFQSLGRFLYNIKYTWGQTWEGYTVQLHPVLSLTLCLCLLALAIDKWKNKTWFSRVRPEIKQARLFVVIALLFFVFLQSRASYFFYKWVPGAEFIQFPWRLLTFIQVLLLIPLGMAISRITVAKVGLALSIAFLFACIAGYPGFRKMSPEWGWFDQEHVNMHLNAGVFGTGEYIPLIEGVNEIHEGIFKELYQRGIESSDSIAFVAEERSSQKKESISRQFWIETGQSTELSFPINYTGLERIYILKAESKEALRAYRTPEDPRIKAYIPSGEYELEIVLPCFRNLFR